MKKQTFIAALLMAALLTLQLFAGSKEFRADTEKITGSGSMWTDYQFGRPGIYSEWHDYFNYIEDDYAGKWVMTNTLTAGTASFSVIDSRLGILLIENGTGDDNARSLQANDETFLATSSRNIYCEARFAINDATQSDAMFGLVVRATTPLSNTNGIYFRKDDGAALSGPAE